MLRLRMAEWRGGGLKEALIPTNSSVFFGIVLSTRLVISRAISRNRDIFADIGAV